MNVIRASGITGHPVTASSPCPLTPDPTFAYYVGQQPGGGSVFKASPATFTLIDSFGAPSGTSLMYGTAFDGTDWWFSEYQSSSAKPYLTCAHFASHSYPHRIDLSSIGA